MYNVMLIDDDVPMLKVLQQMIEWEHLDLHITGSTYSSVKALHLFKETLPDIVITDIGLPKMNGIELAAEFTAIKPTVRIIFLTCHEEFHYAQQAVKLDADDYLLKDQLTAEQLEESLRKSIVRLKGRTAADGGADADTYSLELLKRALFQMIMDGADLDKTRSYASRVGIEWHYACFMMGIIHLRYSDYEPLYNHSNISLIRYAIYNIALEIAQSYKGITPFIDQDHFMVLYNYRSNLAGNDQAYLQSYLEELLQQVAVYLKITLQIVTVTDKLVLQAAGSVYQQIRSGKPEFYKKEQLTAASSSQLLDQLFYPMPQDFSAVFRSDLERTILEKDIEGIRSVFLHFGQETLNRKVEPDEFTEELIQLLREAELLFSRRKAEEDVYAYINGARTMEDALELAIGRLERLAQDQLGRTGGSITSREPRLQVIQSFIDDHLSDNITSIDIAQYLYLNPSYFSRYFKRMSGLSFTDYVHQYKMKIAANMLKNSGQTLETLAVGLGYSDRAYFSKVFKKYIGFTPSQFKQKHQLLRKP
ncbi:response regulator transcription factor [Paenibacillus sp. YAF4_2]|uniref:response regulator transcription factor n=1 Tax=Paenibacillus sp. YAF4_2 TaxID=3233085 RepID=UPI003F956319